VAQTRTAIATLTDDLSRQDPLPVATLTRKLIEREGLPIPEDSPSLHTLQLAVHRALLELHRGVLAQLQGDQERTITDPELAKMIDRDGKPVRTVNDLIDEYDREERKRKGWSDSTVSAKQPVYRLLRDTVGGRPVEEITRERARAIAALVEELPAGLGKPKLVHLSCSCCCDRNIMRTWRCRKEPERNALERLIHDWICGSRRPGLQ
jgi:hypothetical protein